MRITITRTAYTRDICRGYLRVEGCPEYDMLTLESALPRNLDNYVGHALPPGEYPCNCFERGVTYKGVIVHIPWIMLDDVPWFPNAQFIQQQDAARPKKGQIFIGTEYTDLGFTIANPNDEAMKVWARLSDRAHRTGEDITLVIEHADDITFEDTYKDKARIDAEEQERMARRESLINELLGKN